MYPGRIIKSANQNSNKKEQEYFFTCSPDRLLLLAFVYRKYIFFKLEIVIYQPKTQLILLRAELSILI